MRAGALLCTLCAAPATVGLLPRGPETVVPAPMVMLGDSVGERPRIDRTRLLGDLAILAHDSMEGRRMGTPGSARARRFLIRALEERGVAPLNGVRTESFRFDSRRDSVGLAGVNVLGVVPGTEHPDRFLLVTAHYDHLGIRNGEIYNGADDNASGTAALLSLAGWFQAHPPLHSIVFAALDGEEPGLLGARAFVQDAPVPLDQIILDLNMDMVSRSEAGELYVAGTYQRPWLSPLVEQAAAVSGIHLLKGHDRPDVPRSDDWTLQSDHGAFHQAGVPFLYFGVEDHPGYHRPEDDVDQITPDFYVEAVETVLDVVELADEQGEALFRERSGG